MRAARAFGVSIGGGQAKALGTLPAALPLPGGLSVQAFLDAHLTPGPHRRVTWNGWAHVFLTRCCVRDHSHERLQSDTVVRRHRTLCMSAPALAEGLLTIRCAPPLLLYACGHSLVAVMADILDQGWHNNQRLQLPLAGFRVGARAVMGCR